MADNIANTDVMKKQTILLLDDENDILKSLQRVFRADYDVVSFDHGAAALEYLNTNEVAVIISDMRMPEMDGADFLAGAQKICPDSARILLTGYSDLQSTVRAVNIGGIHAYISKPWDNETLKLTVANAAEFYRLTKEKQHLTREVESRNQQLEVMNRALAESNQHLKDFSGKLEQQVKVRTKALRKSNIRLQALLKNRNAVFKDVLKMIAAIIQYRTGFSADHTERIANQAKGVAVRLNLSEAEIGHVYLSALLHQIGLTGAKQNTIDLPDISTETHSSVIPEVHADVGANIVGQLKRFEPLVEIIKHQDELYDGTGKPDHLFEEQIPLASRILKVIKDYDFYVAFPLNTRRITPESAQHYLKQKAGLYYDPKIVQVFLAMLSESVGNDEGVELCVGLSEVKPGMVTKRDLYLPNGNLMLTAGMPISAALLARLKEIEKSSAMPISVYIE